MDIDYFFLFSSFIVIFCSTVYFFAYKELKREQEKRNLPELKEYPGVTIVVPVWNELNTIAATLESLLAVREAYKGEMEIIAIDDHSTDISFSIMKDYAKKYPNIIRAYQKDGEKGKSESLNQGTRLAKYNYVGCVDADSYPDPESVNQVMKEFGDPLVGGVATKLVVKKPHRLVEWFQHIEYVYSNFTLMSFDAMDAVYITRGPLSIFRKEVLIKVGGFMPKEVTPTEDMEITFRIRKAGYKVRANSDAMVYTSVMPTWKALFWQRMRWNRGTLINFWLHRDMMLDKRYGMFSMFVMPTASIMIGMVAVIIMYLVYHVSSFFYQHGLEMYWLFNAGVSPKFSALVDGSVYTFPYLILLVVSVFCIFFLVYTLGFVESREKPSLKHGIVVLLTPLIYNPVQIFFWVSAMILQVTKFNLRWR